MNPIPEENNEEEIQHSEKNSSFKPPSSSSNESEIKYEKSVVQSNQKEINTKQIHNPNENFQRKYQNKP